MLGLLGLLGFLGLLEQLGCDDTLFCWCAPAPAPADRYNGATESVKYARKFELVNTSPNISDRQTVVWFWFGGRRHFPHAKSAVVAAAHHGSSFWRRSH